MPELSAPTSLVGYSDFGALGLDGYGTLIDYLLEQVPELMHPMSVRTYARMRHEPQLAAIIRVYTMAIVRANWSIDGSGCRDEVTARIADDLGLPILGYEPAGEGDEQTLNPVGAAMRPTGARRRKFSWAKHLRLAAPLSMTFGHAPFAQQWQIGDDGKYRLEMVQERMPQTIGEILLNPDGTLKAAVQGAIASNSVPHINTANHQLVWYAREREGSNYYGQSLIRESYAPWLIKDQMLRVNATSHRRNGMGVWQVTAPPGAVEQQILEAQRIAATTRAGEAAGIGLPPGFTAELKGMSGTLPDTLGFINYLDRQMTRSTLTSLLDMATAERGSRSLGETVMQMMVYAQQAEALRLAEDGTEQIVIPLVDANFGEDEPAPQIVVGDVGADQQLTAQDMNWLLEYGGLTPDDVLEEHTRQRYGLPPIDLDTRREPNAAPNAEPPATTPTPAGGDA